MKETVVPLKVQTLGVDAVSATARPELADAATEYVEPPTVAPPGGDDVKLIDCGCRPTANDC